MTVAVVQKQTGIAPVRLLMWPLLANAVRSKSLSNLTAGYDHETLPIAVGTNCRTIFVAANSKMPVTWPGIISTVLTARKSALSSD